MPSDSLSMAKTGLTLALLNTGVCQAIPSIEITKIDNREASVVYYRVLWPHENDNIILCTNAVEDCMILPCKVRKGVAPTCNKGYETVIIPAQSTLAQARNRWVSRHGEISSTFDYRAYLGGYEGLCFNMAVAYSTNPSANPSAFLPGTHCAFMPPPNLTCSVSDNLNINYGTLADDKADAAKAGADIEVRCSAAATVTLSIAGPRKIDLGRALQLQASLFINNKHLADGFSFKAGTQTTTLRVTSILEAPASFPLAGPFQGSSVLMMTYE